jgi:hypothetical protein
MFEPCRNDKNSLAIVRFVPSHEDCVRKLGFAFVDKRSIEHDISRTELLLAYKCCVGGVYSILSASL